MTGGQMAHTLSDKSDYLQAGRKPRAARLIQVAECLQRLKRQSMLRGIFMMKKYNKRRQAIFKAFELQSKEPDILCGNIISVSDKTGK
jgi:hypothetical protein